MRRIFFILIFITTVGFGATFEEGKKAFFSDDYTKAFKILNELEQRGSEEVKNNTMALYFVGHMYDYGKGVKQDYKKAFQYYEKAANQGLPFAQYGLGAMYSHGHGVKQDYKKAFQYYEKAANQDLSIAQYRLGLMYYLGDGVNKDYEKSIKWFEKACDNGYKDACSITELHKATNNSKTTTTATTTKQTNVKTEKKVTIEDAQRAYDKKNYKKAFKIFEQLAVKGDAKAQYELGSMYDIGIGVKQDYRKAFQWYEKAANQDLPIAQNSLGTMYYWGIGVDKEYNKAIEWYEKAANQNLAIAQESLGYMYRDATGIAQNNQKAVSWFEKACRQGRIESCKSSNELTKKLNAQKAEKLKAQEAEKSIQNNKLHTNQTSEQPLEQFKPNPDATMPFVIKILVFLLSIVGLLIIFLNRVLIIALYPIIAILFGGILIDYVIFIDKPKISFTVHEISLAERECRNDNDIACDNLAWYYASQDNTIENIKNLYYYELKAMSIERFGKSFYFFILFFILWPLHFVMIFRFIYKFIYDVFDSYKYIVYRRNRLLQISPDYRFIYKVIIYEVFDSYKSSLEYRLEILKQSYLDYICNMIFKLNMEAKILECLKESSYNISKLKSSQTKNKKLMLKVAKIDCGMVSRSVDDTLKKDKDFIRECSKICPSFFLEIDRTLLGDNNFVIESVLENSNLKTHLSRLGSREMFLQGVQKNPLFLDLIPVENKKDKEFVLLLIKLLGYTEALKYADSSLLDDRGFILSILKSDYANAILHIPQKYKSDMTFVFSLIKMVGYAEAYKYADKQMIDSEDFGLGVIDIDFELFEQLPDSLKTKEVFVLKALKREPKIVRYLSKDFIINLGNIGGFNTVLNYVDDALLRDKEFMLEVAKTAKEKNESIALFLEKYFKEDRDFAWYIN